ncbi:uncharacterized protein MELLADRAFT_70627 [Melampsora larici-populina 98AG31]|uniref:Uncharacterized protein n=1 Tax=Melampsora larici-populina (strain 98AG31 / pathotype 3-4-7) TaxID=747676 RepID=F4R6U6_MELLP|nr:uncharacterized protein MELLADRAFT_70627 [Melampsora larici-populina 98AG31]EGG12393.1 hypothetical protein MELLADRAFT_70627 [Melampsora larici-populina 98AG31]
MMEFPKLRVVGSFYLDEDGLDMAWLHWPMMRNVRTLVMFDTLTTAYWEEALELAGVKAFRTVPNLKHIIFVSQFDDDMSPELVKAFKTRGVHCHCVPSLPYDEIMELESKLNDPCDGPKTQSDCLPGGSYWTYRPLEL